MTRLAAPLLTVALVGAMVSAPSHAQVWLRGQKEPLTAPIAGVTAEGVTFELPGEHAGVVGWDRVREIRGAHSTAAAPYMDRAETAWRAGFRLERGDLIGAEPLLEGLFGEVQERPIDRIAGPTSAAICEGLFRCRVVRGAQAASLWPWLEWTATVRAAGPAREGWITSSIHSRSASTRDATTELVPAIPPMWIPDAGLAVVAESPRWERYLGLGLNDPVLRRLAALYQHAAAFELARFSLASAPAVGPLPESMDHKGVKLVWEVVAARCGDADQRRRARVMLNHRLENDPPVWMQAWCHAAIGSSLLRESEPELRRDGVLHLIYVPAAYPDGNEYLSGLALSELVVGLVELNDLPSAAALLDELHRQYPSHPGLNWQPLLSAADVISRGPAPKGQPVSAEADRGGQ